MSLHYSGQPRKQSNFGPRGLPKKARVTSYLAFLWAYYGIRSPTCVLVKELAHHINIMWYFCRLLLGHRVFCDCEYHFASPILNPSFVTIWRIRFQSSKSKGPFLCCTLQSMLLLYYATFSLRLLPRVLQMHHVLSVPRCGWYHRCRRNETHRGW
jgi:hypothetical protein